MESDESKGGKTRNVKGSIHTGRQAVFYRNDPTCSRGLLKPSCLFTRSCSLSRARARSLARACSTCFMYSRRTSRTLELGDVRKRVYLRFTSPPARVSLARPPFALLCRMFDLLSSTCYSPLCRTFRLFLGVVLLMSRSHGRRSV